MKDFFSITHSGIRQNSFSFIDAKGNLATSGWGQTKCRPQPARRWGQRCARPQPPMFGVLWAREKLGSALRSQVTFCVIFLLLFSFTVSASAQEPTPDKSGSLTTSATQTPAAEKPETENKPTGSQQIPDPKHVGGEPDGIVQVANLVYAGTKSSECFADHFLVQAEQDSSISTSRRFHAVKLSSDEIYNFPLVIMTGEGEFRLPDEEREKLKRFVQRGGFLLASAGCSSTDWDKSFRREMTTIFGDKKLSKIGMEHPVFHTVYDIETVTTKHGAVKPLEGISFEGRLGVLYSQDGLNDTAHTTGCCCCGGNEITNCIQINVNILAYCLTH
jgi:hypothetical protein